MNKPLVSVIMCSFNTSENFLREAIKSILNQTLKDFELIIIDDGSSFFPKFDFLNDARIKIIQNDKNMGISYSRNVGIQKANGKYIAIMDSDDIAEPNRLQVEYQYMEENPSCVACGSWFKQFGEKNNVCKRIIDDSKLYKARLLFGNEPTLLDPSSMIRKSIIDDNNIKYEETIKCGMDYLMWVRLTEIGEIHNVKEVLMNYRTHLNQITKKGYKNLDLRIKDYQFKKLHITLTNKEQSMIMDPFNNKSFSLKDYRLFLDKIKVANASCNYFDELCLGKILDYQWHRKILHTKNIFSLIKGTLTIKGYRLSIIRSFLRHFGLNKKMDKLVYGAD